MTNLTNQLGIEQARHLRRNSTDPERVIWKHLRNRQLDGHKFRRQQPVGSYIVDFVCMEKRLVIEVDGGQHNESASDVERDKWIESEGFRVIRFWNTQVLGETEAVLSVIIEALNAK